MTSEIVDLSKEAQARGRTRAGAVGSKPKAARGKPAKPTALADGPADVEIRVPTELTLDQIDEGDNPRVVVDTAEMKALTDSVKRMGVLQPILVRPNAKGRYTIVAGWRRYHASVAAKRKTIPVYVRVSTDDEARQAALVENILRADLDPLDQARALQALLTTSGETQEQVARRLSRTQGWVANSIRLLGATETVRDALTSGKLTSAHARVLVALPEEDQERFAKAAIAGNQSSKQLEAEIRKAREEATAAARDKTEGETFAASVVGLLTSKGLGPQTVENPAGGTDRVIVFTGYGLYGSARSRLYEVLHELGYANAREHVYQTDTEGPKYQCDCAAISVKREYRSGAYELAVYDGPTAMCVVVDHRKAYEAERDRAANAAKKENAKKLTSGRTLVGKALRSGNDTLSPEGHRVALYVIVQLVDRGERVKGLVKRHGGELDANRTNDHSSELWSAIEGMSAKDLSKELAELLVLTTVPNVFDMQSYDRERGTAIRQFYVDQFPGVDEALVRGGQAAPINVNAIQPAEASGSDDQQFDGPHDFPEQDLEPCAVATQHYHEQDPETGELHAEAHEHDRDGLSVSVGEGIPDFESPMPVGDQVGAPGLGNAGTPQAPVIEGPAIAPPVVDPTPVEPDQTEETPE